MPSFKPISSDPVSGSGTVFALRAIGLLLLVRWLHSMDEAGFATVLQQIPRSPMALLHVFFIFLLIVLPGARPGAGKPFHPLPRWLRQLLRVFAWLGLFMTLATMGAFVFSDGPRALFDALGASNGWPAVLAVLYLAVAWLCRARALWRTRATAGHYAIGRFGIALESQTGNVTVWDQNRKIGQYAAQSLQLERRQATLFTRVILHWHSLAAVGHNRRRVIDTRVFSAGEKRSAEALAVALERLRDARSLPAVDLGAAPATDTGAAAPSLD